jgi:hypothetical protein
MKDTENQEEKARGNVPSANTKVHVTVNYTSTGADKKFNTDASSTLDQVIAEGYGKLKETRRPTDRFFCSEDPRHDLAPHMGKSLLDMFEQSICVTGKRNQLEFEFDIDTDLGGAAS